MNQAFYLSGTTAIASGLVFIAAAILMQEVRSQLVASLISQKSPLSMELSDWSTSGGRIPGHYGAIKKEFIWGPQTLELASNPITAPLVRRARLLYAVREVGRFCGFASLAWFLWVGVSGAP
jgi:hypothetical protein